MLYTIIYTSAAAAEPTDAALRDILSISRANNARDGITGLLLYADQAFFQVLEGPEAAVRETFRRIGNDGRHRNTVTLLTAPISARSFGDWRMGFRRVAPQVLDAHIAGFTDALDRRDWSAWETPQVTGRVRALLGTFRQIVRG